MSPRVKGGVREARHISEAMTRLLKKISKVLVEIFVHFMKNTIFKQTFTIIFDK